MNKIPIFHPYNTKKLIWDIFTMLIIVMLVIYIPLHLAFGTEIESNY